MRSTRTALLAVAALGLTACSSGAGQTDPAAAPAQAVPSMAVPSPTADARAELLAAVAKTSGTTSAFTTSAVSGGATVGTSTGQIDPATQASTVTTKASQGDQSVVIDMIRIGPDVYLRLHTPLPGVAAGTWIAVPASEGALSKLGINPDDPANLSSITAGLVDVGKKGPGTFHGTLDLTKTPAGRATTQQLGDAAKSIPFDATVGDGYLVNVMIVMPGGVGVEPSTTTVRYSAFGTPVTITRPAGAVPAPAALLEALR